MRVSARHVLGGTALVALGFLGGTLVSGQVAKKITRWTREDLKWKPVPGGLPFLTVAAWGTPGGAFCNFTKFPKGTKITLHHHTGDVSTVVLVGTFGSREEGSNAPLLAPGSYESIPGGLPHTTECSSAMDCIVYTCGPQGFDLVDDKPVH
jgi:hypothetical protein